MQGIANDAGAALCACVGGDSLPVQLPASDHEVQVLEPDEPVESVPLKVNAELQEQVMEFEYTGGATTETHIHRALPYGIHPYGLEADLEVIAVYFDNMAARMEEDALEDPVALVEAGMGLRFVLIAVAPGLQEC